MRLADDDREGMVLDLWKPWFVPLAWGMPMPPMPPMPPLPIMFPAILCMFYISSGLMFYII